MLHQCNPIIWSGRESELLCWWTEKKHINKSLFMFYRVDTFVYTLFYLALFTQNFSLFLLHHLASSIQSLCAVHKWRWMWNFQWLEKYTPWKGMRNVHEGFYICFPLKLNFNMIEKNFHWFSPCPNSISLRLRVGYLLTLRRECFSVQMGINDKRVPETSNIFGNSLQQGLKP